MTHQDALLISLVVIFVAIVVNWALRWVSEYAENNGGGDGWR